MVLQIIGAAGLLAGTALQQSGADSRESALNNVMSAFQQQTSEINAREAAFADLQTQQLQGLVAPSEQALTSQIEGFGDPRTQQLNQALAGAGQATQAAGQEVIAREGAPQLSQATSALGRAATADAAGRVDPEIALVNQQIGRGGLPLLDAQNEATRINTLAQLGLQGAELGQQRQLFGAERALDRAQAQEALQSGLAGASEVGGRRLAVGGLLSSLGGAAIGGGFGGAPGAGA